MIMMSKSEEIHETFSENTCSDVMNNKKEIKKIGILVEN